MYTGAGCRVAGVIRAGIVVITGAGCVHAPFNWIARIRGAQVVVIAVQRNPGQAGPCRGITGLQTIAGIPVTAFRRIDAPFVPVAGILGTGIMVIAGDQGSPALSIGAGIPSCTCIAVRTRHGIVGVNTFAGGGITGICCADIAIIAIYGCARPTDVVDAPLQSIADIAVVAVHTPAGLLGLHRSHSLKPPMSEL